MRALAITASNRAAAGVYEDRSGPVLVELLRSAGIESVAGPVVVPDGEPVEAALREAVAAGYDVVVTTGGTGLTPGDLTPEMTRRVIDREVPGIAEAVRAAGAAVGVPAAILSRGIAGLAGRTLIVNLPGSTGGVRDGMAVLSPVLGHAVDQARGGDHVAGRGPVTPLSGFRARPVPDSESVRARQTVRKRSPAGPARRSNRTPSGPGAESCNKCMALRA